MLLLTGWTDYAFSTDNVAASPGRAALRSRRGSQVDEPLGRVDRRSRRTSGFPVGRPQTVVVDLAGRWLGPSREVRIATSMPIYWDQVLVGDPVARRRSSRPVSSRRVAALRWRGFSAETSPDGREPFGGRLRRRVSAVCAVEDDSRALHA